MVEKEQKQKVEKVEDTNKQDSPTKVMKKMNKVKRIVRKHKSKKFDKNGDREFDKRIIDIRRVSRVYKGGKRMRLSVFIAVGDKKGKIGLAIGKGADVRSAEAKAYSKAVKNMSMINLKGRTIPHDVETKYKSSKIIMKPAAPGTGIVAGSAVRSVAELVGIKDLLSKRFGSTNNITIAYATLQALKELKLSRL